MQLAGELRYKAGHNSSSGCDCNDCGEKLCQLLSHILTEILVRHNLQSCFVDRKIWKTKHYIKTGLNIEYGSTVIFDKKLGSRVD